MQSDVSRGAVWLIIGLLVAVYLCVMHLVIPNMGGSGSDMPTSLCVWLVLLLTLSVGTLCLLRTAITLIPGIYALLSGAVLMTLPLAWCPRQEWLLEALPRFVALWAGVLLLLVLIRCRFNARQREILLYSIGFAALIQAIYSLLGLYHPTVLSGFEQQVLRANPGNIGVFQQRNVTASFLATGAAVWLFLLGAPIFRFANHHGETVRAVLVGAIIMLLFATLTLICSRIGWLSALCIYPAISGLYWRRASRWRRCLLVVAPAVGITAGILLMQVSLHQALSQHHGSNVQRLMILRETWHMICRFPLSGWGYGSFEWQFNHFIADRAKPIENGLLVLTHPHNEILYWWVEGGGVALGGILLLAYAGVVIFLRSVTRQKLACLCCVLPLLLHTQVEYPFYQSGAHWLTLMVLVSLAAGRQRQRREAHHCSLKWLAPPLALVCLAMAAVVLVTLRQQSRLTQFERRPDGHYISVLALHETGLATVRLRKDRAAALIVEYQHSGDINALRCFIPQATRWLDLWVDADMYDNLINVNIFMGNPSTGKLLQLEAGKIFTEDRRFHSR